MKNGNCLEWIVSRFDRTGVDEMPWGIVGVFSTQSKARECVLMWLFGGVSDDGISEDYNCEMNREDFITTKAIWRIEEFEIDHPLC